MIRILLFAIFAGMVSVASGAVVIDRETKVEMSITDPIPAEKTAEKELCTYLEKIFGKHTPAAANKKIILKYDEKLEKEEAEKRERQKRLDEQKRKEVRGSRLRSFYYEALRSSGASL